MYLEIINDLLASGLGKFAGSPMEMSDVASSAMILSREQIIN